MITVAVFLSEAGTETLEKLNKRDLVHAIEAEIQNLPPKPDDGYSGAWGKSRRRLF